MKMKKYAVTDCGRDSLELKINEWANSGYSLVSMCLKDKCMCKDNFEYYTYTLVFKLDENCG